MMFNRRQLLKAGAAYVSATASQKLSASITSATGGVEITPSAERKVKAEGRKMASDAFRDRGYYITFMRGTTFSYETWQEIVDAVHADGGNLVILWMAGAFPSRKFPITWKYNSEHQNVQHNFAGKLIDYAHAKNLKVLLGLTPYGYDGVNQYPLERPELKAIDRNGNFTKGFGLDAWGFNLNPYRTESRQFMLSYAREMYFEFYPNADGLLLESSDYAVAFCSDCPDAYYEKEFEFVKQISAEVWTAKPDAIVAIYPFYFSGAEVPGMGSRAAKEMFDPRWTLFFTERTLNLNPDLIQLAKSTFYWNSSPTFGNPKTIQTAARTARDAGITGYIPSFEPWTYVLEGPDLGDQFLVGKRLDPFGFGWLKRGESPANEILICVNRLAYRAFSRDPDLSFEEFRIILGQEMFGENANTGLLDDLLFLGESFFLDRTWVSVCALASPEYVKGQIDLGRLGPARLEEYRQRRERIAVIDRRYAGAQSEQIQKLHKVAHWITTNWQNSSDQAVIEKHLR